MKPSSKTTRYLPARLCCAAAAGLGMISISIETSATPLWAVASVGLVAPQKFPKPIAMRHRRTLSRLPLAGPRLPDGGVGFALSPLLSGVFQTAPDGEAMPEGMMAPVDGQWPRDLPPACVVPLVMTLKAGNERQKLPKVTYGSPGFCPPPVIAKAP